MSDELPIQMFKGPPRRSCAEGYTQLLLRMPIDVRLKLSAFAKASYRSLTGEIVLRLEASLENQSIDEHGVIVVHSPTPLK